MARFSFPRIRYKSSQNAGGLKNSIEKHPFLLFGLPFVSIIVAASFLVTPITAQRFEYYDQKYRKDERQGAIDTAGIKRRKFDAREEYYRLAAKDLDNWEQRRIPRAPGEPDRGF